MYIKMKLKASVMKPACLRLILFIGSFLLMSDLFAINTTELAKKIAVSLRQVSPQKYTTIAFSQIQGPMRQEIVKELIEYTENEIVGEGRFQLIDRRKLQLILREQKFNLTGMVSQDKYKTLGKLAGVDLFIYGRYYGDTIVLKAIDVESSALAWAEIFHLQEPSPNTLILKELTDKVNESLRSNLDRLLDARIRQISFWGIKSEFDSNQVVDYLSVAITKDGNFQVVDRENLQLILEEQKLNMADFIDEKKAKQMGELYGVDAFIYGGITKKPGLYVASLRMLNIFNGVMVWGKTIRFNDQKVKSQTKRNRKTKKSGKMAYVPAGLFIMGYNGGPPISAPAYEVPVKAFYIDRTEVSNFDYQRFVRKFKHRPPPSWPGGKISNGKERMPVVKVNWNDARLYCKRMGKRLPREVEWEKAFRGEKGRSYPWSGNTFYPNYARTVESDRLSPLQVSKINKDVSIYGVQHMAGNVREWVADYLKPYPGSQYRLKTKGYRVIRGGSWAQSRSNAVGWFRGSSLPTYGWEDVGFRCAKSAR